MLAVVFLATYAIARGRIGMALGGVALLAAGFYLGYHLHISATLADRVRMWQSPWDNVARGGDQVAQALWALSAGGTFGTGLGLGDTRYLPAGHTDLDPRRDRRGARRHRAARRRRRCTSRSSGAPSPSRSARPRPTTGSSSRSS